MGTSSAVHPRRSPRTRNAASRALRCPLERSHPITEILHTSCETSRALQLRGKLKSMSFTRITVRADQMGGVPCIRGLRIPIATVVGMVADGMSSPEILAAYPDLEAEDVREAMRYAAEAVRERELPLAAAG